MTGNCCRARGVGGLPHRCPVYATGRLFAQMFPDFQIVSPLVSKLSWTHFVIVMPLKDELQREFYLTMAAKENLPVEDNE